jgi:hypothetical protein
MLETSRAAYLFQCEGDLYAVSYDITGANIPRSPCLLSANIGVGAGVSRASKGRDGRRPVG